MRMYSQSLDTATLPTGSLQYLSLMEDELSWELVNSQVAEREQHNFMHS